MRKGAHRAELKRPFLFLFLLLFAMRRVVSFRFSSPPHSLPAWRGLSFVRRALPFIVLRDADGSLADRPITHSLTH